MPKMPDRIGDGPSDPEDAAYNPPIPEYDFDDDHQRRVDADAKLVTDLGWLIQHITDHNAFPKADLIDTLKRAKRRVQEGFYGNW